MGKGGCCFSGVYTKVDGVTHISLAESLVLDILYYARSGSID